VTGLGVRCADVVHIYRSNEDDIVALRGVDLVIRPGESVALLGPSGSGKSTLLALLGGLLTPSAGRLWIGEDEISALGPRALLALRSRRVSSVLQGAARNLLPYASAVDNVRFTQRTLDRAARRRATDPRQLLASLGLMGVADHRVARLSGGEQQRVAMAVAVANSPGLLLADEPTSQLDSASRDGVLDSLDRINEMGTTVVTVTHDPLVAARAGRQVRMRFGRVGEQRTDTSTVGSDGSIRLPEALIARWPPGSPVTVIDDGDGLRIRRVPRTGGDR
jgi:putative ABC transport system ATP-binding protein